MDLYTDTVAIIPDILWILIFLLMKSRKSFQTVNTNDINFSKYSLLWQGVNPTQESQASLSHGREHWVLRRLSKSLRGKQAYQLPRLEWNGRLEE